MNIKIKNRFTGSVIVSGEHSSTKECLEKNKGADLEGVNLEGANLEGADLIGVNLRGAYLEGANLEGVNLEGAYLRGADLEGANLRDAKGYGESLDIFQELVRKQRVELFLKVEWQYIGQIIVYRLCWDSIKKRFGKKMLGVFMKLADKGFDEYYEKYKQVLED